MTVPDSPLEHVLSRLQGVRPCGGQHVALCPAHDDSNPSLAVAAGRDGRVLLKCYRGCTVAAICAAIGLEKKDLFADTGELPKSGVSVGALAFDKRLPVQFLRDEFGLTDDGRPGSPSRKVLIPYRDQAGEKLFERTRSALRAKDGTRQPKGVRLVSYGQWLLPRHRAGGVLILVEGESDTWTLTYHGYPVLGVPGAEAARVLTAADLDGFATVYVWRDGRTKADDTSGDTFVAKVVARVRTVAPAAAVKVIGSPDFKDPNEVQQRLGDDGFRAAFDAILAAAQEPPPQPAPASGSGGGVLPLTDYGNAQRLVARHGRDFRYVGSVQSGGAWYVWDRWRWREDETGAVVRMAKDTVRHILDELPKARDGLHRDQILAHARQSESRRAIDAMIALARSEPGVGVERGALDRDTMSLNVQNGVIDLTTGELRPHDRDALATKLAPVEYDPDAKCPTWEAFLARVFSVRADDPAAPGNAEMIAFVRRLLGYCLTGSVREQVLPIFWGGGSNGKTTLLDAVRRVMGVGYYASAPPGLLMMRRAESHPTELTVLYGARLVVATETGRGGRLNEELVKKLTGGDPIPARRMREDWWVFDPTHKLVVCTNHRPRVSESDDGIWRRLVLVPFRTKFWNPSKCESGPDHLRQDKELPKKLAAESPGILAWMVRGCLEWQRDGLNAPVDVVEETAAYQEEEDRVQQFLADCCLKSNAVGPTPLKEIYEQYADWCKGAGVRPTSRTAFAADLRSKNLILRRGHSNVMQCVGLALKNSRGPIRSIDDL